MNTLFLNNKYATWYFAIITQAQNNPRTGYVERHHIIPRCLGGSNAKLNLVDLTAREHYIVHALLPKCLVNKQHQHKLWCAFRRIHFSGDKKFTSRLYDILKPQIIKAHSEALTGIPQRKRTVEERAAQSDKCKKRIANITDEEKENRILGSKKIAAALTGRKRSPEVCQKISIARTGVFNVPIDYDAWLQNKKNALPRQLANTDQIKKGERVSISKLSKNKKYSDSEKCNLMKTKLFRNLFRLYANYSEITTANILHARKIGTLTKHNQISIELLYKFIGHIPGVDEVNAFIAAKGVK